MPQIHSRPDQTRPSRRNRHVVYDPYGFWTSVLEFVIDALLWLPRLIARGWRALFDIGDAT